MKIFLDTASLKEIQEGVALGVVDGITTNPSLLAKESGDPEAILKEICRLVDGPISAEVVATDAAGMVEEGRHWAALHENIVVKCPCTLEGLKATRALTDEGHRVNMTLIFSPTQALLAAKAGARYVSPFVGRLDDIATPGMELIEQIVEIYDNYDYTTEVLVASVRGPQHIVEAARMGADVCTCPAKVIHQMFDHPLTDIGLEKFLADHQKALAAAAAKA
jgi:transaldolase